MFTLVLKITSYKPPSACEQYLWPVPMPFVLRSGVVPAWWKSRHFRWWQLHLCQIASYSVGLTETVNVNSVSVFVLFTDCNKCLLLLFSLVELFLVFMLTDSGRARYGWGTWVLYVRLAKVCDLDSFGHDSLSELGLSVSDAVSFMKQICKFIPVKRKRTYD